MSDIEALLRERAGLVQRGLKGRIAQVDAEIKRIGGVVVGDEPPEAAVLEAPENTMRPKAKPRRATKK